MSTISHDLIAWAALFLVVSFLLWRVERRRTRDLDRRRRLQIERWIREADARGY